MCSLGDVVINVRELPDYVARGVVDGVEERWPKKMADFGGRSRDPQQERLIVSGGNRYFYVA